MRDMATGDASRMYALLSSLCHSPVSWYTSGPAQKFILRQIKLIDSNLGFGEQRETPEGGGDPSQGLDVCLLMLYGHILFTSTSYTYALGEFCSKRFFSPPPIESYHFSFFAEPRLTEFHQGTSSAPGSSTPRTP